MKLTSGWCFVPFPLFWGIEFPLRFPGGVGRGPPVSECLSPAARPPVSGWRLWVFTVCAHFLAPGITGFLHCNKPRGHAQLPVRNGATRSQSFASACDQFRLPLCSWDAAHDERTRASGNLLSEIMTPGARTKRRSTNRRCSSSRASRVTVLSGR